MHPYLEYDYKHYLLHKYVTPDDHSVTICAGFDITSLCLTSITDPGPLHDIRTQES